MYYTDVIYEATLVLTTQPCLMVCLNKEEVQDYFFCHRKGYVNVKHDVLVPLLCLWLFMYFLNVCLSITKVPGRKPRLIALLTEVASENYSIILVVMF